MDYGDSFIFGDTILVSIKSNNRKGFKWNCDWVKNEKNPSFTYVA